MRRIVQVLTCVALLGGSAILLPSRAAAAVSQPPEAVVHQPYSFRVEDPARGAVVAAVVGVAAACTVADPSYYPYLPTGLSMDTTGLISGTPTKVEQAQFCVRLTFADNSIEWAPLTLTVSSGYAALDPVLVPLGTQAANLPQNLENLYLFVGNLFSCVPPDPRYCPL